MKKVVFEFAVLLSFLACKKESNNNIESADFPPIVVEESTADFNVLFYGNFCVNCPNAHYKLYVDDIYMGKIAGCYSEGDCKCDSNAVGLHTIIASGTHTYKAVPYCGSFLTGEEDTPASDWYIEESFEVPADDCISVYVSRH